ncbi:MAG: putative metal-dependent hydrolase [Chitinophagaceae bacterium]|nr:putative metal-dependent hydrolase [Chitinophagaceae bacterium]
MNTDPRYPIGRLSDQQLIGNEPYSDAIRNVHSNDIRNLPQLLEYAVQDLDAAELNTPYRPGGWTLQQVVHHVADSHMNAYTRFKLALTEDNPTIKPYDEAAWAMLKDTELVPVNISLTLLHALHARWYVLLQNISEEEWQRTVYHPAQQKNSTLWQLLASYAWHGKHHTAHITHSRQRGIHD